MESPTKPTPRRGALLLAGALILIVLPALLRLWPIGHGFPATSYVPDTHIVRGALGMAKEKDLVPPAGRYTTYPNLLPWALLPVYGAQYALGRARGEWAGSGEYGYHLLEHPARAHLPARVLVALLGALTAWATYRAARAMGLRTGAWVAAWLLSTGLLHAHFSVQERPWVPMTLFMVLSAWAAARYVRSGRVRHLLWSGVAAALACATHQSGLATIGIPGLAWLFGPLAWRGGDLRRRLGQGFACVGLFAVLALLLGYPALLVHGSPERLAGESAGDLELGGQQFIFGLSGATFTRLAKAFVGYDPVLVLLALLGLGLALRTRAALPSTVFALLWAALFMTNVNDHVRYLLPLSVLLAPVAGFAAERLWGEPRLRWVLVPLLALPLVQVVRFGHVLRQEDTRAIAAARLAELHRTQGDEVTAIDCNGPVVPKSRGTLDRIASWRELYSREAHRVALFEAGAAADRLPGGIGLDVVPLEDLFDYDRRHRATWVKSGLKELGSDPNVILRQLGVTSVLLVDRNPEDAVPSLIVDDEPPTEPGLEKLPALRVVLEPLFVVDPLKDPDRPVEARLPTELDFALFTLWRIERPGPRVALHRLR